MRKAFLVVGNIAFSTHEGDGIEEEHGIERKHS
jgi:hypothetical protein